MTTQASVIFPCECEHAAHTEGKTTPNGNPGHRYMAPFAYGNLIAVSTPYGTFVTCKDCALDCYKDFPKAGDTPGRTAMDRCPDCGEYGCPNAPCGVRS